MKTALRVVALAGTAVLGLFVLVGHGQNLGSGQVPVEPPSPPRDPARELAMKVQGSFTLASVGDVMIRRPASMIEDPGLQSAIKILRDADIAVGNMEGNLADIPHFEGPLRGMMGSKEVAADLKAMGFDLMNRANNHIFDSDREGMITTAELLTAAGIVHAGTGKNLEDARAPQLLDTPKGRIAIVGMHTPNGDPTRSAASNQEGNVGGRPGLNPLRYTTYVVVNQEQFDALKKIRASVYTPPPGTTNASKLRDPDPKDRLQLFDQWYQLGATPGTKTFEMNRDDLTGILRSIRNGKYLSNFLVATIHAHQGPIVAQQWLFEDQAPDFLIDFAHKTIDNGADAFVGHGPHVVRGIEIYKGKPIFYGLGEFFYQWHMDATLMSGSFNRPLANDNQIDAAMQVSASWKPINYESVIALSRFDKGQLVEVRLYPTDGRFDGPVSMLGIPRAAPPEIGQRILARIQKLSQPFGTAMTIEGNIGVIRPRTTTTAGQQ
jgi:poly-gamma-glutamate capsule biosynthesis protein CapA/YwtB (metallophosphatase superfamily)